MLLKQQIIKQCEYLLIEKINTLENILQNLSESATNNNKSSAGDKHEIGRAMIHIEQEAIGKQLQVALQQKIVFDKIDFNVNSQRIIKGSLIETNKGYVFICLSLGKIMLEDESVMIISADSPLGKKLLGLTINQSTEINNTTYNILRLY